MIGPDVELLAPAGDPEAMRAAVANGANAIYFGLSNFNARHRATNFTLEELPATMRYLHEHNVRGYVAFNTLIFSSELEEACRFITSCAEAGVDALIVQDLGLARLIARMCPTIEVHGSTQMTLTEARGIEFVKKLGVSRVILARELSLPEIDRIIQGSTIPVEVFVHGALCVSYSGQCLTSEALGGRSANRGQCAQACRLPYDLIVDGEMRDLGEKAYLLSPQDLAAYDIVEDLVKAGVKSFKIEGRLKSAHYVAATTQTYRAALDAAVEAKNWEISKQQHQDLYQSFSRGFTHGFLDGVDHQKLVHARFPKSRGVRVGTVSQVTRTGVVVDFVGSASADRGTSNGPLKRTLRVDLKAGDGVVFDEGHPEQDEQGGRVLTVSPRGKDAVELTFHRGDVNLSAIAVGAIVWKTDDPAVRKRLEQSYSREDVANRARVDFRVEAAMGKVLRIKASDGEGHEAVVESAEPMQRAEKFPLTVELLREQLGRLGQTPFELGKVELVCDGPVMGPKSVLNELRRRVVEKLLGQRERAHVIERGEALAELRGEIDLGRPGDGPVLTVMARTMEQLHAVLDWRGEDSARPAMVYCDFEEVRRYKEAVDAARAAQLPIGLATLRVVKPHEEGLLNQIAECGPDAVLVRNLAAISYYSEQHPALPMLGDYALNVANELTAQVFAQAGVTRMVPSYDLNWHQLAALLKRFPPAMFEAVVHQHMPMFHMEHCVFAHTLSTGKDYRDCGRPCEKHQVDLKDRVGQAHPLVPDIGCRNTLFNAAAQSAAEYVPRMKELGIGFFRIELLRENAGEAKELMDRYAQILSGHEEPRAVWRQLRVLNQLGVTRGTMEY
jgi:putative protease